MNENSNGDVIIRRERDVPASGGRKRTAPQTANARARASSKGGNKPGAKKASAKKAANTPSLFQRHRDKIAGVLLGLFALLLLLALLSYTPYDEANASLSFSDLIGLLQGDEGVQARADTTHNWLGLLGAVMAHFLYVNTIGYASLIFPVLIMIWAGAIFRRQVVQNLIRATSLTLALGVLAASFAGVIQLIDWMPTLAPEWSGSVGQFIATISSQLIGSAGAFLLLMALTAIALIIGLDIDLEDAWAKSKVYLARLGEHVGVLKNSLTAGKNTEEENEEEEAEENTTMVEEEPLDPGEEELARAMRRRSEQSGEPSGWNGVLQRMDNAQDENEESENLAPQSKRTAAKTQATPPSPKIETAAKRQPAPVADPTIVRREAASEAAAARQSLQNDITKVDNDIKQASTFDIKTDTVQPRTAVQDDIPIQRHTNKPFTPERLMNDDSEDNRETHTSVPQVDAPSDEQTPTTPSLTLTLKEQEAEQKSKVKTLVESHPLDEEIIYEPPKVDILIDDEEEMDVDENELKQNARILQEKLQTFKIEIENLTVTPGPVVTQYEFVPAAGVKVSQIENLANDISLALKARGIRIIAPVPGRGTVACEIPNAKPTMVRFGGLVRSKKYTDDKKSILPLALGKTISGEVITADLAKMPHLLIAGSTGSGKSVGVNTIINSLLYRIHPRRLKLMIIDPKKVEMTFYKELENHFLAICPDIDETIITTPQNAVTALKSLVIEMEQRYDVLAKVGQRNITDYNKKVIDGAYKDTTDMVHREMPYIVCIVDELADLMMTAGKEVEESITRLAQLARAIGIHMVVATQRPSVDVITGLIKANFPARIAYMVSSKIDSRTILDMMGAEHLLGNGDMLYLPGGAPKPVRVQNSFITTEEVEEICRHIGRQIGYSKPYELPTTQEESFQADGVNVAADRDELFNEAARIVVRHQQGSVSLLQRRLKVGYSRAARIVDQLEDAGVVGSFDGSKARQVLFESEMELEAVLV